MRQAEELNWKEELIRCLVVAPDWESRISNQTVVVSDFCEFHITRGEFARVKVAAKWDLPMTSLIKGEVRGVSAPTK
jgi:hypothetical protein